MQIRLLGEMESFINLFKVPIFTYFVAEEKRVEYKKKKKTQTQDTQNQHNATQLSELRRNGRTNWSSQLLPRSNECCVFRHKARLCNAVWMAIDLSGLGLSAGDSLIRMAEVKLCAFCIHWLDSRRWHQMGWFLKGTNWQWCPYYW